MITYPNSYRKKKKANNLGVRTKAFLYFYHHPLNSEVYNYTAHTLQLLRQEPGESLVPTMYSGFFAHSPVAAQPGHLSSSSWHSSVFCSPNGRTWIHFVADHFSPSMTGQLPCRLFLSVVALGWRLKNSKASPFTGFTANIIPTFFVQNDQDEL